MSSWQMTHNRRDAWQTGSFSRVLFLPQHVYLRKLPWKRKQLHTPWKKNTFEFLLHTFIYIKTINLVLVHSEWKIGQHFYTPPPPSWLPYLDQTSDHAKSRSILTANIMKIYSFALTSIFFVKDSIVELYEDGFNHNILWFLLCLSWTIEMIHPMIVAMNSRHVYIDGFAWTFLGLDNVLGAKRG